MGNPGMRVQNAIRKLYVKKNEAIKVFKSDEQV